MFLKSHVSMKKAYIRLIRRVALVEQELPLFRSSFGIIKQILSSYEVNSSCQPSRGCFPSGYIPGEKQPPSGWQLSMFTSDEGNHCIMLVLLCIYSISYIFHENIKQSSYYFSQLNAVIKRDQNIISLKIMTFTIIKWYAIVQYSIYLIY
jgi:hypothetical protein